MAIPYRIPATKQITETMVANSRFITTVSPVFSVEEARQFLAEIRTQMPDANHHVYAFRIGYGNSTTEGVSDDGEPNGTAGPPVLSVLRGTDIGDVIIIVTRYFGGTKLGTGGLVRAYSEAAHIAFNQLRTELKINKILLGIESPYHLFELLKRLIAEHEGVIEDEEFTATVTILVQFPETRVEGFTVALTELSSGSITPIVMN